MKHLEKFENFLLMESVEKVKKNIEVELSSKLKDMKKDEINKLYSDLNKVSQKLGLSMEEMKDAKLVAKKLQELVPNSHNENIFIRAWDYIKNKYNTLMMKIGFGSFAASTVVMWLKPILETNPDMQITILASMISFLVMTTGAVGSFMGVGTGDKNRRESFSEIRDRRDKEQEERWNKKVAKLTKLLSPKVVKFFKECESDSEFKKKVDEIEPHIIRFRNKNASAQLEGALIRKFNLYKNKAEKIVSKMGDPEGDIFMDMIKIVIMGELKIVDMIKKVIMGEIKIEDIQDFNYPVRRPGWNL